MATEAKDSKSPKGWARRRIQENKETESPDAGANSSPRQSLALNKHRSSEADSARIQRTISGVSETSSLGTPAETPNMEPSHVTFDTKLDEPRHAPRPTLDDVPELKHDVQDRGSGTSGIASLHSFKGSNGGLSARGIHKHLAYEAKGSMSGKKKDQEEAEGGSMPPRHLRKLSQTSSRNLHQVHNLYFSLVDDDPLSDINATSAEDLTEMDSIADSEVKDHPRPSKLGGFLSRLRSISPSRDKDSDPEKTPRAGEFEDSPSRRTRSRTFKATEATKSQYNKTLEMCRRLSMHGQIMPETAMNVSVGDVVLPNDTGAQGQQSRDASPEAPHRLPSLDEWAKERAGTGADETGQDLHDRDDTITPLVSNIGPRGPTPLRASLRSTRRASTRGSAVGFHQAFAEFNEMKQNVLLETGCDEEDAIRITNERFVSPSTSVEQLAGHESEQAPVLHHVDAERYGELWNEWGKVLASWQDGVVWVTDEVRELVCQGVPDPLRCTLWQMLAGSFGETELKQQYVQYTSRESTHETAIIKDIGRTFPDHEMFRAGEVDSEEDVTSLGRADSGDRVGRDSNATEVSVATGMSGSTRESFEQASQCSSQGFRSAASTSRRNPPPVIKSRGQLSLARVCRAYSLHDPEVGFCQGMPFVVGILLMHMPEEEAFALFVNICQNYGQRLLYLPGMEYLQMTLHSFEYFLRQQVAAVYKHFRSHGLQANMYASQWFLTMYASCMPVEITYQILDMYLLEGREFLIKIAVAIMKDLQEDLCESPFEQCMEILKVVVPLMYAHDPDELIDKARHIEISTRKLQRIEKDFLAKLQKQSQQGQMIMMLEEEKKVLNERLQEEHKNGKELEKELRKSKKQVTLLEQQLAATESQLGNDIAELREQMARKDHVAEQNAVTIECMSEELQQLKAMMREMIEKELSRAEAS
eukprot:Clim_evm28s237 gene=Clim_evmTU28s237